MTRTPIPNCPQPETPIRDRAWTDEQITAAARALCKDASEECNVNFDDNWKTYGELFRDQVLIVMAAVNGATP